MGYRGNYGKKTRTGWDKRRQRSPFLHTSELGVTQGAEEVLLEETTDLSVTQGAEEVLLEETTTLNVTQGALEVLTEETINAVVSQAGVEVFHEADPDVRVSQAGVEVFFTEQTVYEEDGADGVEVGDSADEALTIWPHNFFGHSDYVNGSTVRTLETGTTPPTGREHLPVWSVEDNSVVSYDYGGIVATNLGRTVSAPEAWEVEIFIRKDAGYSATECLFEFYQSGGATEYATFRFTPDDGALSQVSPYYKHIRVDDWDVDWWRVLGIAVFPGAGSNTTVGHAFYPAYGVVADTEKVYVAGARMTQRFEGVELGDSATVTHVIGPPPDPDGVEVGDSATKDLTLDVPNAFISRVLGGGADVTEIFTEPAPTGLPQFNWAYQITDNDNVSGQTAGVTPETPIPADGACWRREVFVRKQGTATALCYVEFVIRNTVSGGYFPAVTFNAQTGVVNTSLTSPQFERYGVEDWDSNWWRVWTDLKQGDGHTQLGLHCYPAWYTLAGVEDGTLTGSQILTGYRAWIPEVVEMGDSATARLDLLEAGTDGVELGDAATEAITFPVAGTDGVELGDSGVATRIVAVAGTDGVELGDSVDVKKRFAPSTLRICFD